MITQEELELEEIRLIGLAMPSKTTNENGQSNIDCGNLWQHFETEDYYPKIPGKSGDDIYAIYHNYEGDYTEPFAYFIGCPVVKDTDVPEGMDALTIPAGSYRKAIAKGKMPDCIANAWKEIWAADIDRAYRADIEIYGERSQNWNDAEVDILISVE
jgi:predicted transcriptional regulator YdeE